MSVLEQESLLAEVFERLRKAAHSDRAFDAAQMQLINLSEIIRSAGENWPQIKDRIRAGSVQFLKGCLDDDDMVIPAGDGFLIIFADGSDAAARAEELRMLLLEFYLGEEELRRLGIRVSMRRLESSELHAMIAPPPPPSEDLVWDGCVFAPIWTARAKVIASYLCTPVHMEEDGPRYGYDKTYLVEGRNDHRDYCQLDLHLLQAAAAAIGRYKGAEMRPGIGVSVHSTTLQNRLARRAYLEQLAELPPEVRRPLFVKIAEIESGVPGVTLADWTGMLRSHVRQIRLQFHHSEAAPPADIAELAVWGAGYRAPLIEGRSETDIAAIGQQYKRWALGLARQRMCFFVDHMQSPELISIAGAAGATFISSDRFWPYQEAPGHVYRAPAPALQPASAP